MASVHTKYDLKSPSYCDSKQRGPDAVDLVGSRKPAILSTGMQVPVADLRISSATDGLYKLTTADIVVLSELDV